MKNVGNAGIHSFIFPCAFNANPAIVSSDVSYQSSVGHVGITLITTTYCNIRSDNVTSCIAIGY